jgi:hypothetical protein
MAQPGRLRGGQLVAQVQHRAHELVERGERLLLGALDPAGAQDEQVTGAVGRVLEQRALADPRLAEHHERRGLAAPRAVEDGGDPRRLLLPADQQGAESRHRARGDRSSPPVCNRGR